MAIRAVIQFGDNNIKRYSKEYLLVDFNLHLNRPCNRYRPEGFARVEQMELVLVPPGRVDLSVYRWFSDEEAMSGRIVLEVPLASLTAQEAESQYIYFEEAKCLSVSEEYHIGGNVRRMLRLLVVAETTVIDGITFQKP